MNSRIFRNDRVRAMDRTTPTRYAIHLTILMDWYPIIGSTGYDLYSFYVVLAALKVSLGARKMADHLGVGRTTIERYTHLLWIAGLIDVLPGSYSTPNRIDIVDPPEVTTAAIADIRRIVNEDPILGGSAAGYWRGALLKRLDAWKPLEDLLPAGVPIIGNGSAPAQAEPAAREIDSSDGGDLKAELMAWRETFTPEKAAEMLSEYPEEQIRNCMNYIDANRKLVKSSATGLLLAMLKNGQGLTPMVDEPADLGNQIPDQYRDIIKR